MKNLLNYKKFFEKSLSLIELDKEKKDNPNLKVGDELVRRIIENDPIRLNNGNDVKISDIEGGINNITTNGIYSQEKAKGFLKGPNGRYKKIFIKRDDENTKYSLTDFEKTDYFGSTRGTSLGIRDTRNYESILAYIFAFKQEYYLDRYINASIIISETDIICDCGEFARTPINVTPELLLDEKFEPYYDTFVRTANKFIGEYVEETILDSDKKYIFYQIGYTQGLYGAIKRAYKRCFNNSYNGYLEISKWTPSDIWAVNIDMENEIIDELEACENMDDLNDLIDEYFDTRDLVGISIKKLNPAKPKIIIIENKRRRNPQFSLENIILSDEHLTKDIRFLLKRRAFPNKYSGEEYVKISSKTGSGTISDVSFEILGIASRYGGCSLNQINYTLRKHKMETIAPATDYSDMSYFELIDEIHKIQDEIQHRYRPTISKSTGRRGNLSKASLISKIQALEFAKILGENKASGGTEYNKVINDIMKFTLAMKNQYFKCPKYARVVDY